MKKLMLFLLAIVFLTLAIAVQCKASSTDEDQFVTGVLSVPFKWHLSDKSVTVGSTLGGYVGYQTKTWRDLTVTPIVGGGLAMVSQDLPGVPSTSTRTGVSFAFGLIGTVGATNATGVQWGVLVGDDWIGARQGYRYEGKPWLAVEIGYNFGMH